MRFGQRSRLIGAYARENPLGLLFLLVAGPAGFWFSIELHNERDVPASAGVAGLVVFAWLLRAVLRAFFDPRWRAD